MTATVQPLFDEEWPDAVLRLCLRIKEMRQHPDPASRTKAQRLAWVVANRQLAALLMDPPDE